MGWVSKWGDKPTGSSSAKEAKQPNLGLCLHFYLGEYPQKFGEETATHMKDFVHLFVTSTEPAEPVISCLTALIHVPFTYSNP